MPRSTRCRPCFASSSASRHSSRRIRRLSAPEHHRGSSMMQGVSSLLAALRQSSASWSWSEIVSLLRDKQAADLVADWPPWARPDQAPDQLWTRRWQPGAYGAGLQALIDERIWNERADLARAY